MNLGKNQEFNGLSSNFMKFNGIYVKSLDFLHFTYMELKSGHAFKVQNIAFRANPRKRAGMHPDSGFGFQKDNLFYKDFHLISRNHIFEHSICKMQEHNASDRTLRFLVKT